MIVPDEPDEIPEALGAKPTEIERCLGRVHRGGQSVSWQDIISFVCQIKLGDRYDWAVLDAVICGRTWALDPAWCRARDRRRAYRRACK